jgi:hypothetical protein
MDLSVVYRSRMWHGQAVIHDVTGTHVYTASATSPACALILIVVQLVEHAGEVCEDYPDLLSAMDKVGMVLTGPADA